MKKLFLIPLVFLFITISCTKEEPQSSPQYTTVPIVNNANKPPVANAGADQSIILPLNSVRIDGTLSKDSDGSINSYVWSIVAGPGSANLYDYDYEKPSVKYATNLMEGKYQFELTVTDNGGLTAKDIVNVTVLPDPLISNPAIFKRFNSVPWLIECDLGINNIASYLPTGAAIQVFVRSYHSLFGSSGWIEASQLTNNSYWYEITNNVLIIHVRNIICDFDTSEYDVLVKWN